MINQAYFLTTTWKINDLHEYKSTLSAPKAESMQLERRYWKIDDLEGNIDEVDGPGKIDDM